jgi:molybdopterin-guanine dinucleotide biosynthesis protein B
MGSSVVGNTIGVVGWKGTGKTTVVEHLVRLLVAKGHTVGTVKHVHGPTSLEPEAVDSMKHLRAGANLTVTAGQDLTVTLDRRKYDLDEAISHYLWACDYIVVEGFKGAGIPKIAVTAEGEAVPPEARNVVAAVYRGKPPDGYPAFALDEIDRLVDYLFENGILKQPSSRTELHVNGKSVPLNDFVQTSLAGVIRGFIASLKDVEPTSTITLHIRK